MSVYRGVSIGGRISVSVSSGTGVKFVRELDPKPSQRIWNHSPDGFNWGYHGSGPAQLALAILLHYTGEPSVAKQHYQQFKREVVSLMPQGGRWELTDEEIQMWLDGKAGNYFKAKFDGASEGNA